MSEVTSFNDFAKKQTDISNTEVVLAKFSLELAKFRVEEARRRGITLEELHSLPAHNSSNQDPSLG